MFRRRITFRHLAMHMAPTPVDDWLFMGPGLTGTGGPVGIDGTRSAIFAPGKRVYAGAKNARVFQNASSMLAGSCQPLVNLDVSFESKKGPSFNAPPLLRYR
jgi:hypothetical protein